jgi:histidine triad (HIT) family protein
MVDSKDCIFCRIARGEIPSKKVFEDSESFAFLDINPRNPGHTLVIPKKHAETLLDMDEEDSGVLFMNVRKVAGKVMAATKAQGISIAQSNGIAAGQVVSHVHFHIIPRFANEGPPGLETMLGTKRMDDKTLDQVAASIRNADAESVEREERPAPRAMPPQQARPAQAPQRPAQAQPAGKPAQKPEKRGILDEDEDDIMDEEIDEDMFAFK